MTQIQIANLEYAARSALAWQAEGYDGRLHYRTLVAALVPAVGILAVVAVLLLGML